MHANAQTHTLCMDGTWNDFFAMILCTQMDFKIDLLIGKVHYLFERVILSFYENSAGLRDFYFCLPPQRKLR